MDEPQLPVPEQMFAVVGTCETSDVRLQKMSDFKNDLFVRNLPLGDATSLPVSKFGEKRQIEVDPDGDETNLVMDFSCGKQRKNNAMPEDFPPDANLTKSYLDLQTRAQLKCDSIPRSTSDERKQSLEHVEMDTKNDDYPCSKCSLTFSTNLQLDHHMKQLHDVPVEDKGPLQICGKEPTKNDLVPEKNCTKEAVYSCSDCSKKFKTTSGLQMHKLVHTGDTPFKCSVCGKGFIQRHNLQSHLKSHTAVEFKCTFCGKGFGNNLDLETHLKIHPEETPYKCDVCNKTFSQNDLLQEHMKSHTGETSPRKWTMCVKAFKEGGSPKNDVGEAKHGCDVCYKTFKDNSKLKRHMMTHSGEAPYKCDECKKAFKDNYKLQRHIRVHTGEAPYGCQVCEKAFKDNYKLLRHSRIHTGESPYICEVCHKAFRDGTKLKKHMRTHAP